MAISGNCWQELRAERLQHLHRIALQVHGVGAFIDDDIDIERAEIVDDHRPAELIELQLVGLEELRDILVVGDADPALGLPVPLHDIPAIAIDPDFPVLEGREIRPELGNAGLLQ